MKRIRIFFKTKNIPKKYYYLKILNKKFIIKISNNYKIMKSKNIQINKKNQRIFKIISNKKLIFKILIKIILTFFKKVKMIQDLRIYIKNKLFKKKIKMKF